MLPFKINILIKRFTVKEFLISKMSLMMIIFKPIYLVKFAFIFQDSRCQHPIFLSNLILNVLKNIFLRLILDKLLGLRKLVSDFMEQPFPLMVTLKAYLYITITINYFIIYTFQFPLVSYLTFFWICSNA